MESSDNVKGEGNSANKFLIVIGREYGSGGRRIGKMLAERLGVSYYDKTLLSEAWGRASNYHLSFDSSRLSDEAILAAVRAMLSGI